jgi:hypothetical protein
MQEGERHDHVASKGILKERIEEINKYCNNYLVYISNIYYFSYMYIAIV